MEKVKAFVNKKHKFSPLESWLIFAVVILSILLAVSVYLLLSNSLYQTRINTIGQVTLGEPVKIEVSESGSFSQAISLYGSMLPNVNVDQLGYFKASQDTPDFVMRAKAYIYEHADFVVNPVEVTFTTDWTPNVDGYHYYNSVVSGGLYGQFMAQIKLSEGSVMLNSDKLYDLIITIETLPITTNYNEIWGVDLF